MRWHRHFETRSLLMLVGIMLAVLGAAIAAGIV